MELKFGCEVIINKGNKGYYSKGKTGKGKIIQSFVGKECGWSGFPYAKDNVSAILENGTIRPCFSMSKNKVDIIGSPIELSDILMAIEKVMDKYDTFSMSVKGVMNYSKPPFNSKTTIFIYYELGKPLSEQPTKTLEALYNILK